MARPWPPHESRAEDELLLRALSLRDHHGLSYGQIIRELDVECTRNTILGKCVRIDAADEAAHKRVN